MADEKGECRYEKGEIGEVEVRFLYDTGATRSFISVETWDRIVATIPLNSRPLVEEPQKRFRAVTGEEIGVHGKVTLTICFGERMVTGPLWIVDILEDAILGIDFIEGCQCRWNWEKGTGLTFWEDGPMVKTTGWTVEAPLAAPSGLESENEIDPMYHAETDYLNHDGLPSPLWDPDFACCQVIDLGDEGGGLTDLSVTMGVARTRGETTNTDQEPLGLERPTEAEVQLPEHLRELYSLNSRELTKEQQGQLGQVLNQYQHVFSKTDTDLGRTGLEKHFIPTGDARPRRLPPRRAPIHMREVVDQQVQEMLDQGVVEPCYSPWAAPLVLVKKKDGSTRICVDYRALNEVTEKDGHPLPRIEDNLDALAGATVFTTLDLTSGYYQVEVAEEDRDKTAFVTGRGHHLRFVTMPFGLCNAPSTFQKLMERVLDGLQWRTVVIYLDDVIVFSKSIEDHMQHLEEVLRRFEQHNLKLKPRKCELLRSQVEFLGHVVTSEGVKTSPALVEKVRDWETPRNQKEVRAFLGLSGYYRNYIPQYSDVAEPLVRLTEKRAVFQWMKEHQAALEALKEKLVNAPILAYPRQQGTFFLDCDASNVAIGAVLSQEQDGVERVIAYGSKALSAAERNYCVTRRELLAVVHFCEAYRYYLYGKKFVVRTDHSFLRWLLGTKEPKDQLARWIQRLSVYDFDIEHRPGRKHGNADALSRCFRGGECYHPIEEEVTMAPGERVSAQELRESVQARVAAITQDAEDEDPPAESSPLVETMMVGLTLEELRERQEQDETIRDIRNKKLAGESKPAKEEISALGVDAKWWYGRWDALYVRNGLLYYRWEPEDPRHEVKWKMATPHNLINLVLTHVHDSKMAGHLGITKTWGKAKRASFIWPGMRSEVERWVRRCVICQQRKPPPHSKRAKLVTYQVGVPWERVAADVAGPFPTTRNGNRYILVVQDYCTKWVEVFAMPDQTAETVATLIVDNVVARFGVFRELFTDQGSNFQSQLMREICRLLGISRARTTPYHPRADGAVERYNRTMEGMLASFTSTNQTDWDLHLPLLAAAYRAAPHESTKETPNMMVMGREVSLPIDLVAPPLPPDVDVDNETEYVEILRTRLRQIHNVARKHMTQAMRSQKRHYDRNAKDIRYKVGDIVWLHCPARKKGRSPKLARPWKGPYLILTKLSDVNYRIQMSPKSKMEIVHADRLKSCIGKIPQDLGFKRWPAEGYGVDEGATPAHLGGGQEGTEPQATDSSRATEVDPGPAEGGDEPAQGPTVEASGPLLEDPIPEPPEVMFGDGEDFGANLDGWPGMAGAQAGSEVLENETVVDDFGTNRTIPLQGGGRAYDEEGQATWTPSRRWTSSKPHKQRGKTKDKATPEDLPPAPPLRRTRAGRVVNLPKRYR